MSSITDMANITTDKASSSEALSKPTNQQLLNQNTVFSMLHFFLILLEYTNLWDFCHTCPLLFNKYKKHINYSFTEYYTKMYKIDDTFRAKVLSRIANPQKQLCLNIKFKFITVEELSVLGNVYYLCLYGCTIIGMRDDIIDLSVLENVHTLNLSYFRFSEIKKINKIDTLILTRCLITNVTPFKDVRVLNLQHCCNIINVRPLRNVRYICLAGCKISDLSGLENADTLDLSGCNYITDVSPLKCVRVLDLSFCKNITNVCALENVVLNLSWSPVDVFTLSELQKKVPTLLTDIDYHKYDEFIKTYFYMFDVNQ
jgi:hypothetical protein